MSLLRNIYTNRAVRFVSVFIFVVVSLLTAYRYLMNTYLNDVYLYSLAKSTAWVLSIIGDKVELEGSVVDSPKEVRAWLSAWARGADKPNEDDFKRVSDSPLTPWEQWSYRSQRARKHHLQTKLGPRVSFTLKYGLYQRISLLENEIERVKASNLSDVEKASIIAKYNTQLVELQSRYQEVVKDPKAKSEAIGKVFPFVIISECGAVEIMAIFLAGVIAFPTTFGRKLLGAVVGIPLMYIVNVFRLSFLGVVGALTAGGMWFEFLHYYVWQAVYIVFVVAVWLAWIEFIVFGVTEEGSVWERVKKFFSSRAVMPLFRTVWFCVKFLIVVIPLVCLWWSLIPVYGWLLVQISGWILKYVMSVPILAGGIRSEGFLNTASTIYFVIEGYEFEKASPIALLVTNLPPFISLMFITKMKLRTKLIRSLIGTGIITLGHILFIVIVLKYQEVLKEYSELPIAVIQFYLTMPFMLWITMVFRELFPGRNV
ncbi:MAG: hypothetical protein N3G21_07570 [Candidatus Hydrogenedentes bacterium]|nr:hypothetical protein [Candidatus Hydrogenedentota bacterium]